MAQLAFGVVGVVAVALDASITTYNFLTDIADAPEEIEILADHVKTLRMFLEPLHDLISKPIIRNRHQNVRFVPSMENALSGFEGVLNSVADEVRLYVKKNDNDDNDDGAMREEKDEKGGNEEDYASTQLKSFSWKRGWSPWRRVKYSFRKSSLIELEASLLGRMSVLYMTMAPMDLSWTPDLTDDDRQTIASLRRGANRVDTAKTTSLAGRFGLRGSSGSLASQISTWSWAGIEDANGFQASHPLPKTNVVSKGIDRSETLVQKQRHALSSNGGNNNIRGEYSLPRRPVAIWSGDYRHPATAAIDTGSRLNFITRKLVLELEASGGIITPNNSITNGSIMLVLRVVGDSDDYTQARFHVFPWVNTGYYPFDLILGMDWFTTTRSLPEERRDIASHFQYPATSIAKR